MAISPIGGVSPLGQETGKLREPAARVPVSDVLQSATGCSDRACGCRAWSSPSCRRIAVRGIVRQRRGVRGRARDVERRRLVAVERIVVIDPAVINGVTVIGDLLRPDGSGQAGGTDRAALWLWNAVKRQVFIASGLPSETLTTAPLQAWIEARRSPTEADPYWASIHQHLPDAEPIIDRLRNRFCIGYEMPPWLVRLLDEHAIPYIDLRLHPVRFLDDLLFAARAARLETQAALLSMAVHESEVYATAGLREAMCRYISDAAVPDNTLLVAGQRRFDSTQIVNGTFFDATPRAAEVHAICARYPAIVLKPHPLDRYHTLLEVAVAAPTHRDRRHRG